MEPENRVLEDRDPRMAPFLSVREKQCVGSLRCQGNLGHTSDITWFRINQIVPKMAVDILHLLPLPQGEDFFAGWKDMFVIPRSFLSSWEPPS